MYIAKERKGYFLLMFQKHREASEWSKIQSSPREFPGTPELQCLSPFLSQFGSVSSWCSRWHWGQSSGVSRAGPAPCGVLLLTAQCPPHVPADPQGTNPHVGWDKACPGDNTQHSVPGHSKTHSCHLRLAGAPETLCSFCDQVSWHHCLLLVLTSLIHTLAIHLLSVLKRCTG